jgi:hypothetical protein
MRMKNMATVMEKAKTKSMRKMRKPKYSIKFMEASGYDGKFGQSLLSNHYAVAVRTLIIGKRWSTWNQDRSHL